MQYAYLDEDPVPAFIAEVKRMRSFAREQLANAETVADRDRETFVQISMSWNSGFQKITGDKVALLRNNSDGMGGSGGMGNGDGGKRWIVTKWNASRGSRFAGACRSN